MSGEEAIGELQNYCRSNYWKNSSTKAR